MSLRSIPVVINLKEGDVKEADLAKALRIDRHRLDHELAHQPGTYAWWASLYAKVDEHVEYLKEKLGRLEARLTLEYKEENRHFKAAEVKIFLRLSHRRKKLLQELREWRSSELILKHAVKAFEQRKDALMAINANTRKEKEHTHE